MESEFGIVAATGGDALVILRGILDAWNAAAVQEAIRTVSARGATAVSLDLGGLDTVDPTGILALVAVARDARRAGSPLGLRQARPPVLSWLSGTGDLELFRLDGDGIAAATPLTSVRIVRREYRARFPARVAMIPEIRRRFVEFCGDLGITGDDLDCLHLALGEGATNAIRHGCREDGRLEVQVRCAACAGELVTEIEDPGPGFNPGEVDAPDPRALRPGGMGIYLMRSVTDDVQYRFGPGRTVLRLVKRLPGNLLLSGMRSRGGECLVGAEHAVDA